ncbi:uncharacterized protein Z518_10109 [Rhinocladiella mackenziei CBS 650.93]|uniref:Class II aldolase/adducin N-terminal domain-containing protein n=1 Tax=Rhinocladiella mackenziei CBS 650.93 TaxID=1442369 RepID=A0A0D2GRY9_9EURO|nr:uncharacterized protein Z518_10109 [Rhinocladiella mackenziei CBS 650.93]KIX01043.1 hypothetical protein Z518_10109 [Rhinocladiella mackenziei CBS 650.93]
MSTQTITKEAAISRTYSRVLTKKQEENGKALPRPTGFDNIAIGPKFKGIPDFGDDLLQKRQWQLEHMAAAFRVFARREYREGTSGHISVRDPIDRDTFWINPLGIHFAMLKASDMVQLSETGEIVGGNNAAVNAASYQIHRAIHAARPDVHAACHTHSKYGKAWSTFGIPLDIINQDTTLFHGDRQIVYDEFGGVVLESSEGERIAAALGDMAWVCVLQNHGLLTCGRTVDEAADLFNLMERACEVQLLVEATGMEKTLIRYIVCLQTPIFGAIDAE